MRISNSLSIAFREFEAIAESAALSASEVRVARALIDWLWDKQRFDGAAHAAAIASAAAFVALRVEGRKTSFAEFARRYAVSAQSFMFALSSFGGKVGAAPISESLSAEIAQSISQYAFFRTVYGKLTFLLEKLDLAAPYNTRTAQEELQKLCWFFFLASRAALLANRELLSESLELLVAVVGALLEEGVTFSPALALEQSNVGEEATLCELARVLGLRAPAAVLRAARALAKLKARLSESGRLREPCSDPQTLPAAVEALREYCEERLSQLELDVASLALAPPAVSTPAHSRLASPRRTSAVGSSIADSVRCNSPPQSAASIDARVGCARPKDELAAFLAASALGAKASPRRFAAAFPNANREAIERMFGELSALVARAFADAAPTRIANWATADRLVALGAEWLPQALVRDGGGAPRELLLATLAFLLELVFEALGMAALRGTALGALGLSAARALQIHAQLLRMERTLPSALRPFGAAALRHAVEFGLCAEELGACQPKDAIWTLYTEHSARVCEGVCERLQLGAAGEAAQRLFTALLAARPSLFRRRPLSQITLCCLYAIGKANGGGAKFAELIAAFSRLPHCHAECAGRAAREPEHVIKFYNREFVAALKGVDWRPRAGAESPTRKTAVKPRTSERGGQSSEGGAGTVGEGRRVLRFQAE